MLVKLLNVKLHCNYLFTPLFCHLIITSEIPYYKYFIHVSHILYYVESTDSKGRIVYVQIPLFTLLGGVHKCHSNTQGGNAAFTMTEYGRESGARSGCNMLNYFQLRSPLTLILKSASV